jgi:hypothetical protein
MEVVLTPDQKACMDQLALRIDHALKREFGVGYKAHVGLNTPDVVTVVVTGPDGVMSCRNHMTATAELLAKSDVDLQSWIRWIVTGYSR